MTVARPTEAGFSLIELLVVLFVVVLLTSLVSLNVNTGAGDRVTRERLDALLAVAAYALEEAQDSGSDFGVLFTGDRDAQGQLVQRAHWRQRRVGGWRTIPDDVFADIDFPPDVVLTLRLDGTDVALAEPETAMPARGRVPQWLFTAGGETQTGELLLHERDSGKLVWRVSWDALGRFSTYRGDSLEAEFGDAIDA